MMMMMMMVVVVVVIEQKGIVIHNICDPFCFSDVSCCLVGLAVIRYFSGSPSQILFKWDRVIV